MTNLAAFDWKMAGKVDPFVISHEELVADVGDAPNPPPLATFYQFDDPKPFHHGLTICRAYRKLYHNRVLAGEVGVALLDGKRLVGGATTANTVLLPEYRGLSLAPELLAEFYAAYPVLMQHRFDNSHHMRRLYTPEGRKMCLRAYEMLVDRKAIIDPTILRRTA